MMTVKLTQKTFEDLKSIQAQLISYSHLNYINSLTLAKQNVHPRVVKVSCSHNEFFFFAAFTTANTAEVMIDQLTKNTHTNKNKYSGLISQMLNIHISDSNLDVEP